MKERLLLFSFIATFLTCGELWAQDTDPYTYPKTPNNDQLENVFLKTSVLINSDPATAVFVSGAAEHTRGMAVKDGKMYFSGRKNLSSPYVPQIYEVDGATGDLLNTYDLPADLYGSTIHPANDIAIDNAGNMFISNLITTTQEFRISYIDITQSPIVWNTVLSITPTSTHRLETFSVFGDIKNGDGFIMIPVANTRKILKYDVTSGVVNTTPTEITINYTGTAASMAQQPRIHIVSDSRFYVDGGTWDPALYNMNGEVVGSFQQNNAALAPTTIDNTTYKGRQNGVVEFKLNDKYYLLVAYTSQSADKPGQFALFEFKDSNKEFKDMTLLYRFPEAGMGTFSDGAFLYATIPQVEIIKNEAGKNKARLYIYSWKNGYGIYDFLPYDFYSKTENTIENFNYSLNNRVITLSENTSLLSVYNTSGQKIQEVSNANAIAVSTSGIFILKAALANSETKTIKIIVP
ncbi:hypothetical protein MASR2M117_08370 [Paludibacter sp.]